MKIKKTNILICGLIWSGSSAAFDLIREFDNVGHVPGEFDDFRRTGRIGDHVSGRINEGIDDRLSSCIDQNSFKNWVKDVMSYMLTNRGHMLWKLRRRRIILSKTAKKIKNSKEKKEKINIASTYIQHLGNIFAPNEKFLLLDQPLIISRHKNIWQQVFNPYRLIFVYRNPEDQIAEMVRQDKLFDYVCSPVINYIYGHSKMGAIRWMVDVINALIDHVVDICLNDRKKTTILKFENLINKYELEKKKIINFLNINETSHIYNKEFFDPKQSEKNIGIKYSFLEEHERDYIRTHIDISKLKRLE